MTKSYQSLNKRLFLWYVGSLLIVFIFTVLVVHVFKLQNGFYFLSLLFLTLALLGFTIIYKITKSLTYLSSRIRMISSKNLDERISGINSNDEIGELAQTFNQMIDRLNEAFKREQQFIADVAHEMKTPLSTLRSTVEITLSRKRSNEEYEKTFAEILKDTNRLSSTLKNVLDLAWSETSLEQKNANTFNLTELMTELSDVAKKMALKKNIKIEESIDKNIEIFGYREKLERALLNIIDNAIKYTSKNGKVSITASKNSRHATIKVKDSGIGIAVNDIPSIFDRFYRGSSTDKVFGSGLGLAIAKSIINAHRGEINVKSRVGEGSTFTIILPLA